MMQQWNNATDRKGIKRERMGLPSLLLANKEKGDKFEILLLALQNLFPLMVSRMYSTMVIVIL